MPRPSIEHSLLIALLTTLVVAGAISIEGADDRELVCTIVHESERLPRRLPEMRHTEVRSVIRDESTAAKLADGLDRFKMLLAAGRMDEARRQLHRWREASKDPHDSQLIKTIERIATRSLIASEFSQRSLVITGVLPGEQNPAVIINGEVFEPGEYFDAHTSVKTVRLHETEFIYKGFTLVKTH